jgi:hypothetical protein
MNIKTLLSAVVVCGVMCLPSFASAQIPKQVTDAYETLYSDMPYKTNFTGLSNVNILGIGIQTKIKGSGSQDADEDIQGTSNTTITISNKEKKGSIEKLSFAMEFRYIADENKMYFKFKKLPKEISDSISEEVRTDVWYSMSGDEMLNKLMGGSPFSDASFVAANKKYPAYVFKETDSTQKETVYAYSVNAAMIRNFLTEQARLKGETITPAAVALLGNTVAATKGTLRIDNKTDLPKRIEVRAGTTGMSSELSASYIFGKIKNITAPKKAISSNALDSLLNGNSF